MKKNVNDKLIIKKVFKKITRYIFHTEKLTKMRSDLRNVHFKIGCASTLTSIRIFRGGGGENFFKIQTKHYTSGKSDIDKILF